MAAWVNLPVAVLAADDRNVDDGSNRGQHINDLNHTPVRQGFCVQAHNLMSECETEMELPDEN